MEVRRDVNLREVFEAKNLARVVAYIRTKANEKKVDKEIILFLHQMLIGGIDDNIAGRFRKKGEYVRVGTHIAPPPEHVDRMIESIITEYENDLETYFLDKIAKFHLDFETTHPFCDGNGRIGRVLINYHFLRLGLPPVIVKFKERNTYYQAFGDYRQAKNTKTMENILALALMESLHKRIIYLKSEEIITLSEYAKKINKKAPTVFNAARRQTIPAFREKGVWKIGSVD